jgi:hypothetical protein
VAAKGVAESISIVELYRAIDRFVATFAAELAMRVERPFEWSDLAILSRVARTDMPQNVCPVCGWDQLDEAPYDGGAASFTICPCCGVEYGYDDATTTHEQLRARWLSEGMKWWSTGTPPPEGWSAEEQLARRRA